MPTTVANTLAVLDSVTLWGHVAQGFQSLNTALHEKVAAAFSLDPVEAEALLRLNRSPGHRMPMTKLARQLTFSTAGLTKIADRLTQRGLTQRSPCLDDRRVTYLELSDEGRTTARRLHRLVTEVTTTAFVDALGPERATQVAEAMAELTAGPTPRNKPRPH
jgi:DNA-binding MarR family transcriptional regulator